jgi:hypothetical protein
MRFLAPVIAGCLLAGCGSSGTTTTASTEVGGATVTAETASGDLTGPVGSIGGSVGVVTVTPAEPPPAPDPAQALFGAWTLARAGDRVCTVDLGSLNAVGDYTAKTRRCTSVELARIALWQPTGTDGILLYDFERRPVVAFRRTGPDLYEGVLAGGPRVTLWR